MPRPFGRRGSRARRLALGVVMLASAACGGDLTLPEGGAAPVLAKVSGDAQAGSVGSALAAPLVVRVTDATGNPVANQPVTWTADAGSVDPVSTVTDSDGTARTTRVLGLTVGEQSASATGAGMGGSSVTFTHTATTAGGGETPQPSVSSSRSSVSVSPHRIDVGSGSVAVSVTVRDEDGDPIEGVAVTIEASGSGTSVSQPSRPTDRAGVATGALESSEPGTKTITVRAGGVTLDDQPSVEVAAPEPTRLVFVVQPSDVREDERITPAVRVAVLGTDGSVVESSEIVITLSLAGDDDKSKLHGDLSRRAEHGVAVFDDLRIDKEGSGLRLRASADGLADVESDRFAARDN